MTSRQRTRVWTGPSASPALGGYIICSACSEFPLIYLTLTLLTSFQNSDTYLYVRAGQGPGRLQGDQLWADNAFGDTEFLRAGWSPLTVLTLGTGSFSVLGAP